MYDKGKLKLDAGRGPGFGSEVMGHQFQTRGWESEGVAGTTRRTRKGTSVLVRKVDLEPVRVEDPRQRTDGPASRLKGEARQAAIAAAQIQRIQKLARKSGDKSADWYRGKAND